MSLFFLCEHHAKYNQRQSSRTAEKPGFQAIAHHQAQPKTQTAATLQLLFSAHKNTPCILYAGGVYFLTAEVGLTDFIRACQLCAGAV